MIDHPLLYTAITIKPPLFEGGMSCNAGQGGLQKEHDWNTLSREEQQTLKSRLLEDNERLQATREHYCLQDTL